MAAKVATYLDAAFSVLKPLYILEDLAMTRKRRDLEAENEELWQRLEDIYDRLGELFEPEEDADELDE